MIRSQDMGYLPGTAGGLFHIYQIILTKEVIAAMAQIDLSKYGITGTPEIIHNPSYEELFQAEMDPALEGYEKGQLTELGAVNVMTGIYTGRSPKDKYIVMDANSKDTVWWTSDEFKNDNHPMSESVWASVKDLAVKELSGKKLYVGRFLRRQRRHPDERPLHRGGGMAGPLH